MRIVIDVDDSISTFSDVLLPLLNYRHHTNYTKSDITYWTWYVDHFDNPWQPLDEPHFWDTVQIYPDAVKVIEGWAKRGHDIKIVTASSFHDMLGYKIKRTLSAFDSKIINERNIIVAQDKRAIKADVRIDDNPTNLSVESCNVLIAQPWNKKSILHNFRTNNWCEIDKKIK